MTMSGSPSPPGHRAPSIMGPRGVAMRAVATDADAGGGSGSGSGGGGSGGGNASVQELERKRCMITRVPILSQLVREQHASEGALLAALRVASYRDGEYIYMQGQHERDLYFVEQGAVLITQSRFSDRKQSSHGSSHNNSTDHRKTTAAGPITSLSALHEGKPVESPPFSALASPSSAAASSSSSLTMLVKSPRKRSVLAATMEQQLQTHHEYECFGDVEWMWQRATRQANAVASGNVRCQVLRDADALQLLAPVQELMRQRQALRAHGILATHRLFAEFSPAQHRYLLDHCELRVFEAGEVICRQGERDDTFFFLLEGDAHVLLEEPCQSRSSCSRQSEQEQEFQELIYQAEAEGEGGGDGPGQGKSKNKGRGKGKGKGTDKGKGKGKQSDTMSDADRESDSESDSNSDSESDSSNDSDSDHEEDEEEEDDEGGEDEATVAAEARSRAQDRADLARGLRRTLVAHRAMHQGFGEMGLLGQPRSATVRAHARCVCAALTRATFTSASQLHGAIMDADAEALLATTLREEWALVVSARRLHLSNPRVAHHLVTFIKKFKAAYTQKFAGRNLYLDFFRRLHQEPSLASELPFLSARIAWDAPSSSLSILRAETRRTLSLAPLARSSDEALFLGRLLEQSGLVAKLDRPTHVDKARLARHLGKVLSFWNVGKDHYLFRQGTIESRAFLILRGAINIVNEDVRHVVNTNTNANANSANNTNANTANASTNGSSGNGNGNVVVKQHEVLATLSAGDSFGELSLVTRLQRSATAVAASDTDLLVLDRDGLQTLALELPGVSVQRQMVERAEFLARLSFFSGQDFGQCIRVAHDVQETVLEPRHLFLQEPAQQRMLYIVRSGEVAVFVKRQQSSGSDPVTPTSTPTPTTVRRTTTTSRSVLVRVATIGAQEFFGVAIASVNVAAPPPPPPSSSSLSSSSSASPSALSSLSHGNGNSSSRAQGGLDLGSTVYMCMTRVVVLELSERGWRRLSPTSLLVIRRVLLERHQWNERMAAQLTAPSSLFHPERPWQQVTNDWTAHGRMVTTTTSPSSPGANNSGNNNSLPTGGSPSGTARPGTQLARHLRDKHTLPSEFAKLFTGGDTVVPATSTHRKSVTPLQRSHAHDTRPMTTSGDLRPSSMAAAMTNCPASPPRALMPTALLSILSPIAFASTTRHQDESKQQPGPTLRTPLPSAAHDHRVLFSMAKFHPRAVAPPASSVGHSGKQDEQREQEKAMTMWRASC